MSRVPRYLIIIVEVLLLPVLLFAVTWVSGNHSSIDKPDDTAPFAIIHQPGSAKSVISTSRAGQRIVAGPTNETVGWMKTYGGSGSDSVYRVLATSDNGFLLIGATDSDGAGGWDAWVVKLLSDGAVDWQYTYGGTGSDYLASGDEGPNNEYVVAYFTTSWVFGNTDAWVLKLDSDGTPLWQKRYGNIRYDYAEDIKFDSDGNIILAGSMTPPDVTNNSEAWLLKINGENGDVIWSRTFGGTGSTTDIFYAVEETSGGNYIAAGRTNSFGNGNADLYVVKVAKNGAKIWERAIGGGGDDYAKAIAETPDGDYMLAGSSISFSGTNLDAWVVKLRETGEQVDIVWQKRYGGANVDEIKDLEVSGNGEYIAVGYTGSAGSGSSDAWILRLAADGAKVWERTIIGSESDIGESIQVMADERLAVAGNSRSFGPGYWDSWLLLLNGDGNNADCSLISSADFYSFDTTGSIVTSNAIDSQATVLAESTTVAEALTNLSSLPVCPAYTIAGTITDDKEQPMAGVTVATDQGQSAVSNLQGDYAIDIYSSGQYVVTPTLIGYRVAPISRTALVPAQAAVDFIIRPEQPTPFLRLPINHGDLTFAVAANANVAGVNKGKVNSWFDHTDPNYVADQLLVRWDGGTLFESLTNVGVLNCNTPPGRLGVTCYDSHNGIDFQQSIERENIIPAATGVVTEVHRTWYEGHSCGGRGCGYGNYVLLDHENGYATLYAHLRSVNPTLHKSYRITDTGTITVGIMGNSGTDEVHLHFGLYYDANGNRQWEEGIGQYTEAVDPYGWMNSSSALQPFDPWPIKSFYLWENDLESEVVADGTGARLSSASARASFDIPVGALAEATTLVAGDIPAQNLGEDIRYQASNAYRLEARTIGGTAANITLAKNEPFAFAEPITVTLRYSLSEMLHFVPVDLEILHRPPGAETFTPLSTTVDLVGMSAMVTTTLSGDYQLVSPLACPADQDEINDGYATATPVFEGPSGLTGIFDVSADEDWYEIDFNAGRTYAVDTGNLAPGVDTVIELYDNSGVVLLDSDDNGGGGLASSLVWEATYHGTHFIRIRQAAGSAFGCDATYELNVTKLSPDLVIERQGTELRLDWNHVPRNNAYELWRSEEPYFIPGDAGSTRLADLSPPAVGSTMAYTDSSPAEPSYYVVQATDGLYLARSNPVGKMNLAVSPGWNLLAWPLVPYTTTLNGTLGDQLKGSGDSLTADQVFVWDGDAQAYDSAWYCAGTDCEALGLGYTDQWLATDNTLSALTLEPDTGFWLRNRSGTTETLVIAGAVTEADRTVPIGTGWQLLGSTFPFSMTLAVPDFPATGSHDPLVADRLAVWAEGAYRTTWYCAGLICEGWGAPWANQWLANDYTPSDVTIQPGQGFWFQNRHEGSIWIDQRYND